MNPRIGSTNYSDRHPEVVIRLIALTPAHVGATEIARRAARYEAFAAGRFSVVVIDQPDRPEVPHSFDTDELVASSQRCVVSQAGSLSLQRDDHVMPDCILDTALESVTDQLDAPVHGILRMNTSFLRALGLRYGAVARNRAVGDALDRRIRGYDDSDAFVGTSILDLPTEAVADTPRWNATLAEHVQALADRGAQVVINGCSAVDVADQTWAVPVIDPTQLALGCLGLAQHLGIHTT